MENNCKHCDRSFANGYLLKRHQASHEKNPTVHKCAVCSKSFSRSSNLARHINLHTQEKKYVCDICFRTFNDHSGVTNHRMTHFPAFKYACEYCQQKFHRKTNLRVHLVSMHLKQFTDKEKSSANTDKVQDIKLEETEQFSAAVAQHSEEVSTANNEQKRGVDVGEEGKTMTEFEREHSKNECFGTKVAEEILGIKMNELGSDTILEEKMNDSGAETVIPACEKNSIDDTDKNVSFDLSESEEVKVKSESEETMDEEANISQVEKSLASSTGPVGVSYITTNDEIKIRIINGKSLSEEVSCWQCGVCGKVFSCKSQLDIHMERHGERKYSCDHCTKTFKTKDDLVKHKKHYLNPLQLECEYCGKMFNKRANLQRHLRLHTGEKPYHCFTCNQSFSDSSNFKNHKWRHADQKPFSCEKCKKDYASKRSFQKHLCLTQLETEAFSEFQCDICEKIFPSKKSLRTHKSSHTRDITHKELVCHICLDKFKWRTRYESHLIGHLKEEEERKAKRAKLEKEMVKLAKMAKEKDAGRKKEMMAHAYHAEEMKTETIIIVDDDDEEENEVIGNIDL